MTFLKYLFWKYFFLVYSFSFHHPNRVHHSPKVFELVQKKIDDVQLILFAFDVMFNNYSHTFRFWNFSSVFSFERFIVFYFLIKSMIHFEIYEI